MNKTEHLISCLIEECAEIQKAATKSLRFGLDDHSPDEPALVNANRVAGECADLIAVIEMLEDLGIIPIVRSPDAIQKKKDKIAKYMKYAKERGTMT